MFDFEDNFNHYYNREQPQITEELLKLFPTTNFIPILHKLMEISRESAKQISYDMVKEYKDQLITTHPELKKYKL